MTKSLKIACIGEAMIEFSIGNNAPQMGFAGDTLNTAIYLRRNLPRPHEVSFVTVLGRDEYSDQMINFIADEGVGTSDIPRHPSHLPGLYTISTADDGERSFHYWRENSAARTLFATGFDVLKKFDVIYFTGITLAILPADVRERFLGWLRDCGKTLAFDSQYRPILWGDKMAAQQAIKSAWQLCDIAFPSSDDETALFSDPSEADIIKRLNLWGVTQGALKRGSSGPRSLLNGQGTHVIYKPATKVVDTTSAGDGFNGAFLASFLQHADTEMALTAGHNCAVEVIAHHGAITPKSL